MAEKAYQITEDTADPCVLCVQWRCEGCKSSDWPNCCDWATDSEPYWPDGSVVPSVFNGCCNRCAQSVADMQEDHRREGIA